MTGATAIGVCTPIKLSFSRLESHMKAQSDLKTTRSGRDAVYSVRAPSATYGSVDLTWEPYLTGTSAVRGYNALTHSASCSLNVLTR